MTTNRTPYVQAYRAVFTRESDGSHGVLIATCPREGIAELVTRACNSHDALIAALESAVFWATENKQRAGTLDVAKMTAALKQAKGE